LSSDIPILCAVTGKVQLNIKIFVELRVIPFIGMLPSFGVNAINIAKMFAIHFAHAQNMN
jgi:hypothetical protein